MTRRIGAENQGSIVLSGEDDKNGHQPIIVFDTDCVLCSGMVAFVLAHERDKTLRFAGAWSEKGLELAARYGLTKSDLDETFLVISEDRALARSDAGFEILRHLRAPWRWLTLGAAGDTRFDLQLRRPPALSLVWAETELCPRAAARTPSFHR